MMKKIWLFLIPIFGFLFPFIAFGAIAVEKACYVQNSTPLPVIVSADNGVYAYDVFAPSHTGFAYLYANATTTYHFINGYTGISDLGTYTVIDMNQTNWNLSDQTYATDFPLKLGYTTFDVNTVCDTTSTPPESTSTATTTAGVNPFALFPLFLVSAYGIIKFV